MLGFEARDFRVIDKLGGDHCHAEEWDYLGRMRTLKREDAQDRILRNNQPEDRKSKGVNKECLEPPPISECRFLCLTCLNLLLVFLLNVKFVSQVCVAKPWNDRRKDLGGFKSEQRHSGFSRFILEKLVEPVLDFLWRSKLQPTLPRSSHCYHEHGPRGNLGRTGVSWKGQWKAIPPRPDGPGPDQSMCCSEPCGIKVA